MYHLVFSLTNEGVVVVFPKITFMTSRDLKCVRGARKWHHAVRIHLGHYFGFYMKSLAQKLTEKIRFFVKFIYVTFCDLHSHRRSQVMVQNERLYISSYQ